MRAKDHPLFFSTFLILLHAICCIKHPRYQYRAVRLIQLADIGVCEFKDRSNRFITEAKAEELHCTYLQKGDILIARLPDPLGRACIFPLDGKYITAVDVAIVRISRSDINPKYVMYMINSPRFRNEIMQYESGTTRKRISRKNLDKIIFEIPSLAEQNRIVSRIEERFSELDNGVETLETIKQRLAVYRQAVLKEAFSSADSTRIVEISEIVNDIRIGPFGTMLHKCDYVTGGIPVINPQHIKNSTISPSANVTISPNKAEELFAYKLQENDIVMGRRGEMGRSAPVTKAEDGWICGTGSILFRLKPEFDATFYAKILSSPDTVHYLEEHSTGTTMKNLNEEIVRHIPVPFITVATQAKMLANLDSKISVCDEIGKTVDVSLQQAEAMRQSILKQAFEGRL